MNIFLYIFLSLSFSAFFSGIEIAFVSSNKLRFELDKKQRNVTSGVLSVFYDHPQQFISTLLMGNNVCLVIYGLLMEELLTPWLIPLGNQLLITLVQTILATIIVLLTGEFLPKTIFRLNPNLWLKVMAFPMYFFYVILFPLSKFTTWLSVQVLGMMGVKISSLTQETVFSRVDLNYLLQETFEHTHAEKEMENEVKILQNALDFSKIRLRDCFVPRTEIVAIDENTTTEELMQTFIETGYSKIPIYRGSIDEIIGYIHSSEMFEHQKEWRKFIKQIPIVPENMAAQKLMKLLMLQRKSIAVVVDEFGGTAGIITLEDIIEEIFGEIEDEHDVKAYVAEQLSENEYLLSGRLEIDFINEKFGLQIPESDDYDTVAGFVLFNHQHFPTVNQVIRIHPFIIKCLKVTNNRIELLKVTVENTEE